MRFDDFDHNNKQLMNYISGMLLEETEGSAVIFRGSRTCEHHFESVRAKKDAQEKKDERSIIPDLDALVIGDTAIRDDRLLRRDQKGMPIRIDLTRMPYEELERRCLDIDTDSVERASMMDLSHHTAIGDMSELEGNIREVVLKDWMRYCAASFEEDTIVRSYLTDIVFYPLAKDLGQLPSLNKAAMIFLLSPYIKNIASEEAGRMKELVVKEGIRTKGEQVAIKTGEIIDKYGFTEEDLASPVKEINHTYQRQWPVEYFLCAKPKKNKDYDLSGFLKYNNITGLNAFRKESKFYQFSAFQRG